MGYLDDLLSLYQNMGQEGSMDILPGNLCKKYPNRPECRRTPPPNAPAPGQTGGCPPGTPNGPASCCPPTEVWRADTERCEEPDARSKQGKETCTGPTPNCPGGGVWCDFDTMEFKCGFGGGSAQPAGPGGGGGGASAPSAGGASGGINFSAFAPLIGAQTNYTQQLLQDARLDTLAKLAQFQKGMQEYARALPQRNYLQSLYGDILGVDFQPTDISTQLQTYLSSLNRLPAAQRPGGGGGGGGTGGGGGGLADQTWGVENPLCPGITDPGEWMRCACAKAPSLAACQGQPPGELVDCNVNPTAPGCAPPGGPTNFPPENPPGPGGGFGGGGGPQPQPNIASPYPGMQVPMGVRESLLGGGRAPVGPSPREPINPWHQPPTGNERPPGWTPTGPGPREIVGWPGQLPPGHAPGGQPQIPDLGPMNNFYEYFKEYFPYMDFGAAEGAQQAPGQIPPSQPPVGGNARPPGWTPAPYTPSIPQAPGSAGVTPGGEGYMLNALTPRAPSQYPAIQLEGPRPDPSQSGTPTGEHAVYCPDNPTHPACQQAIELLPGETPEQARQRVYGYPTGGGVGGFGGGGGAPGMLPLSPFNFPYQGGGGYSLKTGDSANLANIRAFGLLAPQVMGSMRNINATLQRFKDEVPMGGERSKGIADILTEGMGQINTAKQAQMQNALGGLSNMYQSGMYGVPLGEYSGAAGNLGNLALGARGQDVEMRGQDITRMLGQMGIGMQNKQLAQQGRQSGNQALVALLSTLGGLFASDARVKEDIEPLERGLEEIKKLTTYRFRYNNLLEEYAGKSDASVIAQELEKVIPEAVDTKDGIKYIRPMALVSSLMNAVKELDDKISRVKAKERKR